MIGMPGKQAGRTEQLLKQHCAGEQVRPGGPTEREQQVGVLALARRVPVGGADHEACLADPVSYTHLTLPTILLV